MQSKYQVADVLNLEVDHLAEIARNSWNERTLHAIRKCRTKALGGHLDWCMNCKKLHLQFNSCRNRHCPKERKKITFSLKNYRKGGKKQR